MKHVKIREEFLKESVKESKEIRKMYEDDVDGFFLVKTGGPSGTEKRMRPGTFGSVHDEYPVIDIDKGEFVMYDPNSDKPLHDYLVNLLGKWSIENAHEWHKYTVYVRGPEAEDGYEELYSW